MNMCVYNSTVVLSYKSINTSCRWRILVETQPTHSLASIECLTAIWSLYMGPVTACLGHSGLSVVVKEKPCTYGMECYII